MSSAHAGDPLNPALGGGVQSAPVHLPVAESLAILLESCEVHAWQDMYVAAPADFAHSHGLAIGRVQNVVLTRCTTIPFTHFNCVMNLGMAAPTTEAELDQTMAQYQAAGIKKFTVYSVPISKPAQLPQWLERRGFALAGGWDRIYRDGQALGTPVAAPHDGLRVEKVTRATAREWATFIDTTYGLPTSPWLLALVERPGWHHYVLRQHGQIVAVRTMYVHHDGMAWFGIDAPVPGVMAPSFDLDLQLCQAMVGDGLAMGVQYFVADIEAPTPKMDTPAYRNFHALGFHQAYFRSHFVLAG